MTQGVNLLREFGFKVVVTLRVFELVTRLIDSWKVLEKESLLVTKFLDT